MIIKDVKKDLYFEIDNSVEDFFEEFEDPSSLIVVDKWYCDGSGFNGKESKFCFLKDDPIIVRFDEEFTNNDMEYEAVYRACLIAEKHSLIVTDSLLVVNQVNGTYTNILHKFRSKCEAIRNIIIKYNLGLMWIPREENLAGKVFEK